MKRKVKRAYVVERDGGWTTFYGVRLGRTLSAPLIKDFYSYEDAQRYCDMINGKIPRDEKWMSW